MRTASKFALLAGAVYLVVANGDSIPPLPSNPPFEYDVVAFRGMEYDVVRVNLDDAGIELFWKDETGRPFQGFAQLESWLQEQKRHLLFAANAGIYAKDMTPLGLHVENGRELSGLNQSKGGGNFFLKPNGVFYVDAAGAHVLETGAYADAAPVPKTAVQSGPMLVINGALHPKFIPNYTSRYIRNGVGVVSPRQVVFAISRLPVCFHDFGSLFLEELGCANALYLDGSLSGIYVPTGNKKDQRGRYVGMLAITAPMDAGAAAEEAGGDQAEE